MRLDELLRGLTAPGRPGANPEVRGVCHDSRRVEPGDLYVAIVGERYDGRAFAPQAVARGAAAVLGPAAPPAEVASLGVPWIEVDEPRRLLGPLAARLYGFPHEHLVLAGVTGTNGKSTVIALIAAMLDAAGRAAGTVGTLGYRFAGHDLAGATGRTTPEASDLMRALAEMRRDGAQAVAMEVSSHALAVGRVAGVRFDVGVFTNLTRDHLDFHGDFESYFAAKRRLFDQLKPGGRAVVNADDPYGRRLLAELPDALGFGRDAAVRAERVTLDFEGIRGRFVTPRGTLDVASPLIGRYNLENLLAAVAAAEALALPHTAIAEGAARRGPLPGRLEPVECGQPFPMLIDYAHTPAALEAALRAVRELSERKVVLVFGCGGDRDPGKRPLMGEIAGNWADLPVVTSDNPRSEDPLAIIAAVEKGLKDSDNEAYRIMPDRREAIRRAVAVAAGQSDQWLVLVAGKGHEEYQIVGDQTFPFSDREELCAAAGGRRTEASPAEVQRG